MSRRLAYYNEFDPKAAAWLRELIRRGLIAAGDVDERSIKDVTANDLKGYGQVHFFAGIGGWSLALRLAGVPDTEPVWTGSCPCQPFSSAGKRKGKEDARHLWPDMFRLVRERKPAIVFGEQVASAIRFGWLDGVFADLEGEGYACGSAVLGAHSVGAPHIRQRLFWVADAAERGLAECRGTGVARSGGHIDGGIETGGLRDADSRRCGQSNITIQPGIAASNPWSDFIVISFGDGKTRRIEPGLSPLVDGLPGRVGLLRGYGNAIVPQVAAEFVRAAGLTPERWMKEVGNE